MMVLIVGLILFLGVHLLPTSPELRAGLQERMGTNGYKAVFSLLSLAGLSSSCSATTSCSFTLEKTRYCGIRRSGHGISRPG